MAEALPCSALGADRRRTCSSVLSPGEDRFAGERTLTFDVRENSVGSNSSPPAAMNFG